MFNKRNQYLCIVLYSKRRSIDIFVSIEFFSSLSSKWPFLFCDSFHLNAQNVEIQNIELKHLFVSLSFFSRSFLWIHSFSFQHSTNLNWNSVLPLLPFFFHSFDWQQKVIHFCWHAYIWACYLSIGPLAIGTTFSCHAQMYAVNSIY